MLGHTRKGKTIDNCVKPNQCEIKGICIFTTRWRKTQIQHGNKTEASKRKK